MKEMESKEFLLPGDVVEVRHNIPNKPLMWIVDKVSSTLNYGKEPVKAFKGMKCRWFDKNQLLLEATFSTKDIEKIK